MKFTRSGAVTLAAKDLNGSLEFTVTDTGSGIPLEDRERIFEPFTQLEDGTLRSYEGTGLGLAITRRMVDLLRGSIRADAREGGGSSFVVTLPYPDGKPATENGEHPRQP